MIRIKGARENNLRNIDVDIPRDKLTVVTGLSGSGKSSLAFDTIFAESQRRYIESLSAYARQFLVQLKKPQVTEIVGLSPAIAIDQKSVSSSPRSTVGTVTEIYDFLRLLFAKTGTPLCPTHNVEVTSQTPDSVIETVMNYPQGSKWMVLAPMARSKRGEFQAEIRKWMQKGFSKAKIDGQWKSLSDIKKLAKTKEHDIDLVIDQVVIRADRKTRIAESIHTALSWGSGRVVLLSKRDEENAFSIHSSCPICGFSFPELESRLFSFNHPRGYCQTCRGLGTLDIEEYQSQEDGPVQWRIKASNSTKKSDQDEEIENALMRSKLSVCPDCNGSRLRPEATNVLVGKSNIAELSNRSVKKLKDFFATIELSPRKKEISEKIIQQIQARLQFLDRVGVGYLSLDRSSRTLSGGEAQRIRLASQLGSALIGVLYVLDEPSIGLHPDDHEKLMELILELRNRGNTILVVEHDEATINVADFVLDIGPGAGRMGGALVAQGTPAEIRANSKSLTGQFLSGKKKVGKSRESQNELIGKSIRLVKASGNNLTDVTVEFPLGQLIAVTGVSGSGKSTLIMDTLYPALARSLGRVSIEPAAYESIEGFEEIDKIIQIDQSPIGRTPRSTPATYVGLFPLIRELFAQLPDSKVRGYKPGRFSYNVAGGRCEECQGQGQIKLEMHFLANVYSTCPKCRGIRYNRETELIKYKNKSISQVLSMTVSEATEYFKNHKAIHAKLEVLERVGLGYLHLGQSSTTLSGGEAQRIKLSRELSKRATGKTFYILDEPTTGLHFEDIKKLIELLQELVDRGNTVLVIEHNMDVVASSDHIIDMGPGGGDQGGQLVAQGAPVQVSQNKESLTGKYLKTL